MTPNCEQTARPVAQVSNLLYRRFPIGNILENADRFAAARAWQAGSAAIRQVGNLRYLVSTRANYV